MEALTFFYDVIIQLIEVLIRTVFIYSLLAFSIICGIVTLIVCIIQRNQR